MLASNFLTAEQLGISESLLQASIKLLGMLERGELAYGGDPYRIIQKGFWINMKYWWGGPSSGSLELARECGTVGCAGGWIEFLSGGEKLPQSFKTMPWNDLFCPKGFCDHPETFTPDRIAKALRSMLTVGYPDWSND